MHSRVQVKTLRDQLEHQIRARLRVQIAYQLWDHLWAQLWDQLLDQTVWELWMPIEDQLIRDLDDGL